jgi:hypothetical protein
LEEHFHPDFFLPPNLRNISIVEDFDFQTGKRYPPRGILISKLENVILQGGF